MKLTNLPSIGPAWEQLPHIKAGTILAKNAAGKSIDFKEASTKKMLEDAINPETPILWPKQVHADSILDLDENKEFLIKQADAVTTTKTNTVCAILTADCLPVVYTNTQGTRVGVAHAGWRGLHAKILYHMVNKFQQAPNELVAWIGPGIGPKSYEVGGELRAAFLALGKEYDLAFTSKKNGKYWADLYKIAQLQLLDAGVKAANISGAAWDTFTDNRLHSYRRDGEESGRLATVCFISG